MTICTGVNWFFWVLVIFFVNPERTGLLGLILFYASLFLAILGTGSLLGFTVGSRFKKRPIFVEVSISFRRAFFLSIFITAFLLLKDLNLLYWLNILFIALFLIVLEIFFISISRKYVSSEK